MFFIGFMKLSVPGIVFKGFADRGIAAAEDLGLSFKLENGGVGP